MQTANIKFEQELNRFLEKHLGGALFNHLNDRLKAPKKEVDSISEKINKFYREQLQIDTYHAKDRVEIDRIITFSEKKLQSEKLCGFLIDLGQICLSEGKIDMAYDIFRKANKLSNNVNTSAEVLLGLAGVFCRRAKWSKSIETINNSKALFKSILNYRGIAKCENLLGTVYGELGDLSKAKKHLMISLSLINADVDLELAASLYANLGIVYNIQGYTSDSINHLNRSLSLYNKLGYYKKAAEVNINIGQVYFDSGNFNASITALDNAIEVAKTGGFSSALCIAYLVKAQVLIKQNDFYYAAEFADKSLEISHNIDDKLTIADIYKVKGIIERQMNNFADSEAYLLNSLRINKSFNNELNIAETSFELGLLYDKMNNVNSKTSYLRKSQEYYKNIEAHDKVEKIEEILRLNTVN